MTTGYSGTPLVRKLGIEPGHRVLFDGAPDGFAIDGVEPAGDEPSGQPYDVVLLFAGTGWNASCPATRRTSSATAPSGSRGRSGPARSRRT